MMNTHEPITQERIKELFAAGIDCGQVVAGDCAPKLHLDECELRRITACMGGGMMCGETCGAVNAAMVVIGLKYGHWIENDNVRKGVMMDKMNIFRERFAQKYPSIRCQELLGHKIPEEMDQIVAEGTMMTLCPKICADVLEILHDILEV